MYAFRIIVHIFPIIGSVNRGYAVFQGSYRSEIHNSGCFCNNIIYMLQYVIIVEFFM
jgi:hypothetical protein